MVTKKTELDEINRLVGEVFNTTLSRKDGLDDETAKEAIRLTQEKISAFCLSCQLQDQGDEKPKHVPLDPALKEKRHLFLLRLIFCKISHLFVKSNKQTSYDRSITSGIDAYLHKIFKPAIYKHLNEHAKTILDQAGDDDITILNTIQDNPFHRTYLHNVYVRFALSFSKYENAKSIFMNDLNQSLPEGHEPLTHQDFRTIFNALLGDVFLSGKSELDGLLLDYQYGPRTAQGLITIAETFGRDLQE